VRHTNFEPRRRCHHPSWLPRTRPEVADATRRKRSARPVRRATACRNYE
jgi:hypothetical protein